MISFKNWLISELSGKNAYKRMVLNHPSYSNMPSQVRDEFIQNSFGSAVNNSSNKMGYNTGHTPIQPSDFLANSPYKDREWREESLQVTPMNFTPDTIYQLMQRCFGYRHLPTIRNDQERTMTQKSMMDGNNQKPVVLFYNNGKYKLQEGWHRTMNILLWEGDESKGAPSDQIEILKAFAPRMMEVDREFFQANQSAPQQLDSGAKVQWVLALQPMLNKLQNQIDFTKWKPVPLKAFIGYPQTSQPQTSQPQKVDPKYLASTAAFTD